MESVLTQRYFKLLLVILLASAFGYSMVLYTTTQTTKTVHQDNLGYFESYRGTVESIHPAEQYLVIRLSSYGYPFVEETYPTSDAPRVRIYLNADTVYKRSVVYRKDNVVYFHNITPESDGSRISVGDTIKAVVKEGGKNQSLEAHTVLYGDLFGRL